MSSAAHPLLVDVSCPDCSEAFVVPLAIIEESQRLLDELGPCTGLASFECPARYFASLLTPRDVARLEQSAIDERSVSRWENEGGATARRF